MQAISMRKRPLDNELPLHSDGDAFSKRSKGTEGAAAAQRVSLDSNQSSCAAFHAPNNNDRRATARNNTNSTRNNTNSTSPTSSAGGVCIGQPSIAPHHQTEPTNEQPTAASQSTSKPPPAIGIPMAMPSGFGLPFMHMPPPLMYFWMQQMALQQAAVPQHPTPSSSNTSGHSCPPPLAAPKTGMPAWGGASCMPPPPLPSSFAHNNSMPPFPAAAAAAPPAISTGPLPPFPNCGLPPPPPPPSSMPDMHAFALPAPSVPHSLSKSDLKGAGVAPEKLTKADSGSECSENSDFGYVDNDLASFIDSFLMSGPDQSLPVPGGGPQLDLSEPLNGPPLGLRLSKEGAEDVLTDLYSDSVISCNTATQHFSAAVMC